MANEDSLKRRLKAAIKKEIEAGNLPDFWHYCPTDHFYAGIPDVIFCARGAFGWIELKIEGGRVTPIQEWTHKKIKEAGGRGAVLRTVKDCIEFIKSFYQKETT